MTVNFEDHFRFLPYRIYVRSEEDDYEDILFALHLHDWESLSNHVHELEADPKSRYFYTTHLDDWMHILDDCYTLWYDKEIRGRILELSNEFEILTCSMGDQDMSFDFHLFKGGQLQREYVVDSPGYSDRVLRTNTGTPLPGERDALAKKNSEDIINAIVHNYGIRTNYSEARIYGYWRTERKGEKFEFDEDEY